MDNKDVKKYIKYLVHQIDTIEKDIENASKHIELSTISLKSIKSVINQLSEDVFLDEIGGRTIKFDNLKNNKVDIVYTTRSGAQKWFNVPVHPYESIEEKDILDQLQSIAKAGVIIKGTNNTSMPSMEEKAAAFLKRCGKCTN